MEFTNLERKLIEANLDSMKNEYKTGKALENAFGGGASIDLSHGRRFELEAILLNGRYSDYIGDFIFNAFEHDINLGAVVDMIEVILDDNSFSLPDVEEMKKLTQYINEFESDRSVALGELYDTLVQLAPELTDAYVVSELSEILDDVLRPIGGVGLGIFPKIQRQVANDEHAFSTHRDDFVHLLETYGEWVHVTTPFRYDPETSQRLIELASITLALCGVDLARFINAIKVLTPHTVDARSEHPRNTHWL
ncbi:hypothetical protein [Bacillus sp. FSL M8-0077]|uniref:hypothetical protein n=1 Tax=Bacillus sp. FSL M8-0077 TaxID=2954556 RepID=UPI0030FD579A